MPAAMSLDPALCYEALRSRDRRFDGRFWVGVRTTGVYCRPVCPSRTPRAGNVDFYAHPAAAEDDGLRPCRRCRPEAAPGSTRWKGGAGIVDRALRLIEGGALDEHDVATLAARLHVGDRHLRRLFRDHLGTTPDAVARTRRAHLARRLLADTDLRVADVAFAAGFGSIRQCNDVVRAVFRATPTDLRSTLRAGDHVPVRAGLQLVLPARPPFDGHAVLGWLATRTVPGLDEVTDGAYRRRVRVRDHVGGIAVRPAHCGVTVEVDLPAGTHLAGVVAGVRRLFDLDADPEAVDAHLGADPVLAPLVAARPGTRVPAWWSGFEAGVRAVVGQQVSVAAARTVAGRIVAAQGADGTFPEPEALVDAPLESLGMNGRRAGTIRRLAAAVLDGDVVLDGSIGHEDLVASLVALPGIGPWTAEYVALRTGEPDAFPAQDLHLERVLAGADPERWRPWRAYAAMHLWTADPSELPT